MAHVGIEGEVHGGTVKEEWGRRIGKRQQGLLYTSSSPPPSGVAKGQGIQQEAQNTQMGQQAEAGEKSWLA